MHYKLLALDLDDTLLDKKHLISHYNKAMIKRAIGEGILVILSTGRMYRSALPYYQELALDTPMINYNGALVVDGKGEYLYHTPLDPDLSLELIFAMKRYPCHINLYVDDFLYGEGRGKELEVYESIAGIKAHLVEDLSLLLAKGSTKMVAISLDKKVLKTMERELGEIFLDRVSLTTTRPIFLEVMAPGISKGQALKRLVEGYQLLPEEVVAFGDGENDLSMIKYAGLGVAMVNGHDRLKKEADLLAPPNHESGVGQIIHKVVLGGGTP